MISLLFLITFSMRGQDTVSLNSVEVLVKKNDLSELGKKTEHIDSTIKQQFVLQSLSELLSLNSPLFIKSYGPGGIASSAFRGGNASQTAILWNGFNIQNAMLGQSDLALIPSCLFDEVSIEYGGSSALWGSGAVAGSIRLGNKTSFDKGLFVSTSLGGGSFGRQNSSALVSLSRSHFVSSTRLYLVNSANNYTYKDTVDKENPVKKVHDAAYQYMGLMQELRWAIRPKQILSANAWLNSNQRKVPSFTSAADPKTYQYDQALRLSANWSYQENHFSSVIKGAFLYDKINYNDSLTKIYSRSEAKTLIAENENYLSWAQHQQLNFGLNITSSSAVSTNYDGVKGLSKFSLVIGNRSSFLKEKLLVHVGLRGEYFSVGTLPITGNASMTYLLSKTIKVHANSARVYRQPTLNELYWLPGGNTQLKPEQGYTHELEINWRKQIRTLEVFISGAAFSRQIDNWILWVPGEGGNPSPRNIQKVWSRGTETTLKVNYRKNKWHASAGVIVGYVLSTPIANSQENSNTIGKQLIYTPRYTVNGNMSLAYANVQVFFFNQYIGYRYTSSDNSAWLDPYHISGIRTSVNLAKEKTNLVFFASCNNLFNMNYQIIQGRPMPLRNYEIGLTLQFKYKKDQPAKPL